jgi:hypothetical protein
MYYIAQVEIKRHRLGLKITKVAPEYPFGNWTRPPSIPKPPIVPPPPFMPFNTNHKAMIEKYGGAIWDSGQQICLPPLAEQAITPFMHMDPISGALALLIDPLAGYMHPLPTISELTQPPQVPP